MRRLWVLLAVVALGTAPPLPARGAPRCDIVEGAGIGEVRIGMDAAAALELTGPPVRQQAQGSEVHYSLREPWAGMVADYGRVRRISTRTTGCKTAVGIGPGATAESVRGAYAGAAASIITASREGSVLTYPFIGVAFLLSDGRVIAVEVFGAEARPGARAAPAIPAGGARPSPSPAAPSPAPTTAPGTWGVRSATARVENGTLIVSGTVENRARTQAAYAEVRALGEGGRRAGEGNAPLYPSPVAGGGAATFEVRIGVSEIVRRYTVTIRPVGSLSAVLAEYSGEVAGLQQFEAVVAKQLQATVQMAGSPMGFAVVVTNRSPVPVASAAITARVVGTCRVPFPTPRVIQETRTASVVVQRIPPGGSSRALLELSTGICLEFVTWSGTATIGEVKIGE